MKRGTRYTKGAGNSALYLRVRDDGQYWNFSTLGWVGVESTNSKVFLGEYADTSDTAESFYSCSFTPPTGGPYPIEIVEVSSNSVIGLGDTAGDPYTLLTGANAELSSVPSTTSTIMQMIQFLFQYFRNRKTVTATTEVLYKEDATTPLGSSTISDTGTTFTKGEMS